MSDGEALLSEQEKLQLLSYLRRSHGKKEAESGAAPNRVTLKRKSVSELRQPAGSGRGAGSVRAATAPRARGSRASPFTTRCEKPPRKRA